VGLLPDRRVRSHPNDPRGAYSYGSALIMLLGVRE
jgi:hypothetical protein